MKIAFVTNSIYTFGGEQRVVSIIANELSKKYDITIFTTDNPNHNETPYEISNKIEVKYFKPFESNLFIKGIRFLLRFPILNKLKALSYVQEFCYYNKTNALNLKRLLDSNFDIVIAVSGELTILLGLCLKYGLKSKTIGWEHSSFDAYFNMKDENFYYLKKLWKKCCSNINLMIWLNEIYCEQYKQIFNNNCCYIYNPRSFFSEKKSSLKNKIIITCCRIEYVKGLDLLLEAFNEFSKFDKEWILQIVGDGSKAKEYRKYVLQHNLSQRVQFLGVRYDIKELLQESSIFVFPSRWEGYGMSLVEAFEVGVPSIYYNIDGTSPFIKAKAGLVCTPFEVSDLTQKLQYLTSSIENRKKNINNGFKFSNSVSIENISKQWFELIESL